MIAAVNGPAYGGGMELILNCDLVVASQDAVFAFPEVKRGVLAGQGGEYHTHLVHAHFTWSRRACMRVLFPFYRVSVPVRFVLTVQ